MQAGHWLESLVEATKEEIDEADTKTLTPLMHSLNFARDEVSKKLIKLGAEVGLLVPTADGGEGVGPPPKRSMLMVALEKSHGDGQLSILIDLVCHGAQTDLPTFSDKRYLTSEMEKILAMTRTRPTCRRMR